MDIYDSQEFKKSKGSANPLILEGEEDRKTMKELVEFIEEAVREGLSMKEIYSQVYLLLDDVARGKLEMSLREARSGKLKLYKNPEALLKALHEP